MTYNPRSKTKEVLHRGWELVSSVPYKVSSRWVFYKLLQEGYYSKKSDYKNRWNKAVSKARHEFYNGWRPWTLADETREATVRGEGTTEGPTEWANGMLREIARSPYNCTMNKWAEQEYYIELWFEARAMADQFKYYTQHITLVPMGGQPSIPYKWRIAKRLDDIQDEWALQDTAETKPVQILYFGDLDPSGGNIADRVKKDVRKWCDTPFGFTFCGLTPEQAKNYGVPENPDKPGQYQWEALTDRAAKEIIKASIDPYWRQDAIREVVKREVKAESILKERLSALFKGALDNRKTPD